MKTPRSKQHLTGVAMTTCIFALAMSTQVPLLADDAALVAHYTFDEASGEVLKDHSGNGHDGQIHGATWLTVDGQSVLSFGEGDYVDLGTSAELNPTGDRAIVAGVKLQAPSFPTIGTNWTILDGGDDYQQNGYLLRIDGNSTVVSYRHSDNGGSWECIGRNEVENFSYHHVVVTRRGNTTALYIDGILDLQFQIDDAATTKKPVTISQADQSFVGLIDDLAIYRRALSTGEILTMYQQAAAAHGKDASWIGHIRLTPYCHYEQGSILVEADFIGVLPLKPGEQAEIELRPVGGKPIRVEPIETMPEAGRCRFTFPIDDLSAGQYEVAAVLKDAAGHVVNQSAASFAARYEPANVPAPAQRITPPLPQPPVPVAYQFELGADGGFLIRVGADRYPVESAFSWPNGDFNLLGAATSAKDKCEPGWKVVTRQVDDQTYRVTATGRFYKIERTIRLRPTHVNIQDTVTNLSSDAVGILFRNTIDTEGRGIVDARLGGMETRQPKADSEIKSNPTVFLRKPGLGIGMVALDDVYIVQAKGDFDFDRSSLGSTQFALDKDASCTLEWSIYLNRTADYYDFINQVRHDENRNGKVDGALTLYYDRAWGRRGIPTREYVDLRNIKYLSLNGLEFVADDPQVSLNGIEFLQGYPTEVAMLTEQIAAIQQMDPDLMLMFHVAHSLYATNKPEQTFPDSRVLNADGSQATYDQGAVKRYFSQERYDQGWNWWIYYPSLDNSYGAELMRSVDVMVDDMGCKGVFMDGFMTAYGGEYAYNHWDGHTAEIDPATSTITRKVGSVLLLSQDALVAFSRKMRDKGAQVIANNSVITRTIGRETYIIFDQELQEGPWTHLAPTVTTLSNAYRFSNEEEFYDDALNKLKWGNLQFYYGDYPNAGDDFFTHPPIVARMYPITFEEIHAYYVKGRQRLITAKPGVYGWAGDNDLHCAYRYDALGWEIPANYLTTVDGHSVRTQIVLDDHQAAVLRKVPVTLTTDSPVNVVFRQYDDHAIALGLNGNGLVTLIVADGDFAIKPNAVYTVDAGQPQQIRAAAAGWLVITCQLNGSLEVTIKPAGP